ncbi:MAG: Ig-like domain-containing protein [Chloroflexota bacterium]|nr:Ig-like domain-containing protein [Chloroflexota bacterium]
MNNKRCFYILLALLALVAATLACGPTQAAPPTVAVVAPPNGAQVAAGQTVEVQFRAEGEQAIVWVQMTVDGDVVATQQSPLEEGQTPLEGILRWTPNATGAFDLILTAHSVAGQESGPAAVSIQVVEAVAGAPTPTSMPTPVRQKPAATQPPPAQPSATVKPGQPTATQPPPAQPSATVKPGQPTATKPPPTATPTKTPIPSPEITGFYADAYSIDPNQCTTIYWTTEHATEVRLDQEIVSANSDRTYCYGDIGSGSTDFELQATNGLETAVRTLTIVGVEPQVLDAPFASHLSGSVSDSGSVGETIYPGDDSYDGNYIGFITFDITSLPGGAAIKSASLDLGTCSVAGDPFTDLGSQLYVTYLYYGDLDAGDYSASGGEYLGSVYGCPGGQIDVTASLETHKTDAYYQITLSWPVHSDFDGATDDVTYSAPALEIVYMP